jgi:hypothetical protein
VIQTDNADYGAEGTSGLCSDPRYLALLNKMNLDA